MVRKLNAKDFDTVADFIESEYKRRRDNPIRRNLEHAWDTVDRQVRMEALPYFNPSDQNVNSDDENWIQPFEWPAQANALEIIGADAQRLIFPTGGGDEWFSVQSHLSEKYLGRVQGLSFVADGIPLGEVDQDSVDLATKATIVHFHRQYEYQRRWRQVEIEGIKYGTYVPRIGLMKRPVATNEFRGVTVKSDRIPMIMVPSIRNVYLDDSPEQMMQEGLTVEPAIIRRWWQRLDSLKEAAKFKNQGWLAAQVNSLEPQTKTDDKKMRGNIKGQIEVLEYEGDLFISRSEGTDIHLVNHIVTVAIGQGHVKTIRMRESGLPFRSYMPGVYEPGESVYGSSPLMRGRSIQEAITEVANRLVAVAALNAEPPIAYDRADTELEAEGGPRWYPGALWKAINPDAIKIQQTGDPSAYLATLQGLIQQYEDTTHVNDPRRGTGAKSHTTATSSDIEVSRSLLPTEDFVENIAQGSLLTSLYMEYELIKKSLGSVLTVRVDSRGTKGHIDITKAHLPDQVDFTVHGARGIFTARERRDSFIGFTQLMIQVKQAQLQGVPIPDEVIQRAAEEFNITDADELNKIANEAGGGMQGGAPVQQPPGGGG